MINHSMALLSLVLRQIPLLEGRYLEIITFDALSEPILLSAQQLFEIFLPGDIKSVNHEQESWNSGFILVK
jgi:hypothetical protein